MDDSSMDYSVGIIEKEGFKVKRDDERNKKPGARGPGFSEGNQSR